MRPELQIGTVTRVSVTWQDGEAQPNLSSLDLVHVSHMGAHDFWPDEFVVEKLEGEGEIEVPPLLPIAESTTNSTPDIAALIGESQSSSDPVGDVRVSASVSKRRRFGVLERVDNAERICQVFWIGFCNGDCSCETLGAAAQAESEAVRDVHGRPTMPLGHAEISVYDVVEHSEYHYNMGDVVVRLLDKKENDEAKLAPARLPAKWVGELLAIQGGLLHVHWVEGSSSWIRPSEVLVVSSEDPEAWDDDVGSDQSSDYDDFERDYDYRDHDNHTVSHSFPRHGVCEPHQSHSGPVNAVFEALSNGDTRVEDLPPARCTSNALGHLPDTPNTQADFDGDGLKGVETGAGAEATVTGTGSSAGTGDQLSRCSIQNGEKHAERSPGQGLRSSESDGPNTVRESNMQEGHGSNDTMSFSLVAELPGHLYGAQPRSDSRLFAKAAQRESKLLLSSLPPGVFVCACEQRMDLMRAVILGPAKTPYEDGLFVFDIHLPADYPNSPPSVLFHSFGDRLNPNLYNNGKVCLSLLGTWVGQEGIETWNPAKSNLLQVLISIQALILVPEVFSP
jgi:ubiquitin-conjugating enzyme E2 O